jgi:hypothetical protein
MTCKRCEQEKSYRMLCKQCRLWLCEECFDGTKSPCYACRQQLVLL